MTPLTWAIILFAVAMAFVALELFLPSGGVLGVLALAALIGSLFFVISGYGFMAGTIYLVMLAIFVPVLVVAGLNYWPHTSAGRRMLNVSPDGNDEPPIELKHAHLIGKQGVAKTKMLPSGAIKVDGKSYDAVAEGSGVDEGDVVEVVSVDGTQIVVREVQGTTRDAVVADKPPTNDLLSRPASDVIPDPFEEPPPV